MVAAAVVGSAVVSGVASNMAAKKSAGAAAAAGDAQTQQAYAAMEQQNEQFNRVRQLLDPYSQAATGSFSAAQYLQSNPDVAADPYFSQHPEEHYTNFGKFEGRNPGTAGSLTQQQNLLGLNGNQAQSSAMQGIENSPYFQGLVKQGENSLLQNASATGGLRGGNTAAALAQFRPNMLAAAIDQQYQRLGGLTNIGQNAAAGVGNAGQAMANNNAGLLGQVGSAQAGSLLGQAAGQVQGINGISSAFGTGLSGLSGYFNSSSNTGITGTSGGNAGAYSTGASLNNDFGGSPTYF